MDSLNTSSIMGIIQTKDDKTPTREENVHFVKNTMVLGGFVLKEEIIVSILKFLDATTLLKMVRVSRGIYQAEQTHQREIWKHNYKDIMLVDQTDEFGLEDYKAMYKRYAVIKEKLQMLVDWDKEIIADEQSEMVMEITVSQEEEIESDAIQRKESEQETEAHAKDPWIFRLGQHKGTQVSSSSLLDRVILRPLNEKFELKPSEGEEVVGEIVDDIMKKLWINLKLQNPISIPNPALEFDGRPSKLPPISTKINHAKSTSHPGTPTAFKIYTTDDDETPTDSGDGEGFEEAETFDRSSNFSNEITPRQDFRLPTYSPNQLHLIIQKLSRIDSLKQSYLSLDLDTTEILCKKLKSENDFGYNPSNWPKNFFQSRRSAGIPVKIFIGERNHFAALPIISKFQNEPSPEIDSLYCSIVVGPFYLEWDHRTSLIIPKKLVGEALEEINHFPNSFEIFHKKFKEISAVLSSLVVEWNCNYVYDYGKCNCQHFVDSVLRSLDINPCWDETSMFGRYLSSLRQDGFGKVHVITDTYDVLFKSHKEFDLFSRNILSKEPDLDLFDLILLRYFDRIFWKKKEQFANLKQFKELQTHGISECPFQPGGFMQV